MNVYDLNAIDPKALSDGVTIRVIAGEKMTMAVFSMSKGARIPEHAHPHEQMGMVSTGKMKLVIDGKEQIVEAGSAWHIPGEWIHSGECLADDTVVVEFFSPPREDFVQL